MGFQLPDDLDLLSNLNAGISHRINTLTEQEHLVISKNRKTVEQERKNMYLDLIRDLDTEIRNLKGFQSKLLAYVKNTFDVDPALLKTDTI